MLCNNGKTKDGFWIGTSILSLRYYQNSRRDILSVEGKEGQYWLWVVLRDNDEYEDTPFASSLLLFDFEEMEAMELKRRRYNLKNFRKEN